MAVSVRTSLSSLLVVSSGYRLYLWLLQGLLVTGRCQTLVLIFLVSQTGLKQAGYKTETNLSLPHSSLLGVHVL